MFQRLVVWAMCLAGAAAPTVGAADEFATVTLNESNHRLGCTWEVNAQLSVAMNVSVTPNGALPQQHGVRVSIFRTDGQFIDAREVLSGSSGMLRFNLAPGEYYLTFDLGVEDLEDPVGSVTMHAEGTIINPLTGDIVPPRPLEPPSGDPPSDLSPPGELIHSINVYLAIYEIKGPSAALMKYLVD